MSEHAPSSPQAATSGEFLIGVSAENRAAAGVSAGDVLEVDLELDSAPRELEVPVDLRAALAADPVVDRAFAALSYSNQRRIVLNVEGTANPDTRARRVGKAIESLQSGDPASKA